MSGVKRHRPESDDMPASGIKDLEAVGGQREVSRRYECASGYYPTTRGRLRSETRARNSRAGFLRRALGLGRS